MTQYADNPKLLRDRAEEARVRAEQISDPESRRMMFEVAAEYDRLAVRAEERIKRERSGLDRYRKSG